MIARTGAGKTLIFQAFYLLTSLIVIQISPLTTIGEEQKSDLEEAAKRLEGAESRLVNVRVMSAETKKIDKMLISDIMSGKVGLIIISLEAAMLPEFQKFIRYNQDRIGLLVVDEAHLVPA